MPLCPDHLAELERERRDLLERLAATRTALELVDHELGLPPTKEAPKLSGTGKVSQRIRALGIQVGRDMRQLRTMFRTLTSQVDERFSRTEAVTGRLSGDMVNTSARIRALELGGGFDSSQMGMLTDTILKVGEHDEKLQREDAARVALERDLNKAHRMIDDLGRQLEDVQERVGTHMNRDSLLDRLEKRMDKFDAWLGSKGIDTGRIEAIEKLTTREFSATARRLHNLEAQLEGVESKLATLNPTVLGKALAEAMLRHSLGDGLADAVPPISCSEPTSAEEDEELQRRRDGPKRAGYGDLNG